MTKATPDDLEAVRSVTAALKDFDPKDQERILRWAREKLGLSTSGSADFETQSHREPGVRAPQATYARSAHDNNIKSFVKNKNPKTDSQFAAVIAYYYQFEIQEAERKAAINSNDLIDACRKTDWERFKKPAQTLVNAYNQGYFDKAGERGAYKLNSVGENLVAMALPEGASSDRVVSPRRNAKKRNSKKGRGRGRR